jgi:hypothetical protein
MIRELNDPAAFDSLEIIKLIAEERKYAPTH